MRGDFVNCPAFQQATSGLTEYQAINTVLFITLIGLIIIAFLNIVRYTRRGSSRHIGPLRAKFIELEKDYKWRRLKVAYLVFSVIVILIFIGASYGTDTQRVCQTIYAFEVERAGARMGVAIGAIFATALLWGGYFALLPHIYKMMNNAINYLKR